MLAQLEKSAESPVADPETAIDRLARQWHQNEDTAEIAKAALQGETGPSQHTVYGLVNAFTHAAQLLPDERRYELEVLAGQLAQLGRLPFTLSNAERIEPAGEEGAGEDVVSYAERLFGAQVIGRQQHPVLAGGGS